MTMLKINFSQKLNNLVPNLIGIFFGIFGLIIILEVWMLMDIRHLNKENPQKETKIARLISHKNKISSSNTLFPEVEKLVAVKQRIKKINSLTNYEGKSITSLLSKLEKLLPDDAYLIDIFYKKKKGGIKLVAESENVKSLTLFLENLENDKYFSEVILTRQKEKKSDKKSRKQFELKLKEAS